jgi:RNA polymerase sigma factor (sigma-70 family)
MAGRPAGADVRNQLNTLALVGVVGNLSDAQLLGRFLSTRDGTAQAAFTALVGRHGPMVLSVCRQVLGDPHDAQDAFQATFLVLAGHAGSVRKSDSLGSWLHGVALRVALRARADAARRRARERRGAALRSAESEREGVRSESWPEVHQEIARLPARYREPIVLCYLEGLSTEEAALRLGCPRGTVLSRLSRARENLRARLARRGLAPALALPRFPAEPPGAIPDGLATATSALAVVDAVRLTVGGPLLAKAVRPSVLILTQGALHMMTLAKLKAGAGAAVLLAIFGAGVYAVQSQGGAATPAAGLSASAPARPEKRSEPSTAPADSPREYALSTTGRGDSDTATAGESSVVSELSAQLVVARKKFAVIKKQHENNIVPQEMFEQADGEVQILEGRIAGRIQQLEEELELLEVRLSASKARMEGAAVAVELAEAGLESNRKLSDRKVISPEEIRRAELGLRREEAGRDVQKAEVQEVEVLIRQTRRRLLSLSPLLKVEGREPETTPASGRVVPATPQVK